MLTFAWTPKLAVGFPEMDGQHQHLIALMATLNDAIGRRAPREECLALLDELSALATLHFAREEQVMADVGFPRLDLHMDLHRRLLERLGDLSHDAHQPDGRLTSELSEFLNGWLTRHILGPDTQYGVYSGALVRRGGV